MPETQSSFTRCRTLGHAWDTATPQRTPAFGVLMALRCVSCGMGREDILQPGTGELLSRSYQRPDGYRDVGKFTRSEWRVSFLALPTTHAVASTGDGVKK